MIENLRTHPTTFSPRRDDDHWNAHSQTVGTAGMAAVAGENLVGCRDGRFSVGKRLWRRRRNLMIEKAALLVVIDEQGSPAEKVRIGRQDIDDLRNIPGAEVGSPIGVFRI